MTLDVDVGQSAAKWQKVVVGIVVSALVLAALLMGPRVLHVRSSIDVLILLICGLMMLNVVVAFLLVIMEIGSHLFTGHEPESLTLSVPVPQRPARLLH